MSVVGEMVERKDRPAYVRFERRAVEDKNASISKGHFVAKDVDFALVTPPYSRDVYEERADSWLSKQRQQAGKGRIPAAWYERYQETYDRWKRGEEMPLNGTPIKSWPVISPAQAKNLTSINILTVEDLASVNDEGLRRIGMGAVALRDKAKAWLAQANDKGPLTMENAALRTENVALKAQLEQMESKLREASARIAILEKGGLEHGVHIERDSDISADDIIERPQPQPRGRRKQAAAPEPQQEAGTI
jgi:hypothetical protein